MNTKLKFAFAVLPALALGACAPAPKVLVKDRFIGTGKTGKIYLQSTGQAAQGNDKAVLYNVYGRVCDLDAGNQEANCKDTVLLENVFPGSVY